MGVAYDIQIEVTGVPAEQLGDVAEALKAEWDGFEDTMEVSDHGALYARGIDTLWAGRSFDEAAESFARTVAAIAHAFAEVRVIGVCIEWPEVADFTPETLAAIDADGCLDEAADPAQR